MKKKVLAVLLAICMIAGTGVLFANAAVTFSAGSYVAKVDPNQGLTAGNLKAATGTYNEKVTITAKSDVTLTKGTTKVDANNADQIYDFTAGSTKVSFKGKLETYFTIDGTVTGEKITLTKFEPTSSNVMDVYQVNKAIDGVAETENVEANLEQANRYVWDGTFTPAVVKSWTAKLVSLSMGVRFFGTNYNNLVASEIAQVKATVSRVGGAITSTTSSVSNEIKDLMPGDTVTLKASLKNESEKEYYGFYCWVDGSGNILDDKNDTVTVTMGGQSEGYYAAFVELKNRVTIDYSAGANGKIVYADGNEKNITNREALMGDGQVSIMEGRNAYFTFVPDEGYEVAKVLVDGKNVAGFMSLLSNDLWSALKDLIAATDKDNYTYTFKNISTDHTISVEFRKVTPLEAPEGKDLPTVAAEGLTLATGADAANGDSAEGGAAGAAGTTVPAEAGASAGGSAATGVVNPATGSGSAIAVFATLSVAACAAFVTAKKKED